MTVPRLYVTEDCRLMGSNQRDATHRVSAQQNFPRPYIFTDSAVEGFYHLQKIRFKIGH